MLGKTHCRNTDELSLVKKAICGHTNHGETPVKIKVPDPKVFSGTRSAKELENFLWDMKQYVKAAHVQEREKVTITSMYLLGDAKLWWQYSYGGRCMPSDRNVGIVKEGIEGAFPSLQFILGCKGSLRETKDLCRNM